MEFLYALIALAVGLAAGWFIHKFVVTKRLGDADVLARRIVLEARKEAQAQKKEIILQGKDDLFKQKSELESEFRDREREAKARERKLEDMGARLEEKAERMSTREQQLLAQDKDLARRERQIEENENFLATRIEEQERKLVEIAGLTPDEAKNLIMADVRSKSLHEAARMARQIETEAKDQADRKAKEIICNAIQRYAGDYVGEQTVTAVSLPSEDIKGRIIATKPGHTINNKFARLMRREIRKHEIQAPIYNCNEPPVMDVNRIRELLPHRYPMQLVDKVIALGPSSIVGVKNVTSNEPFFTGHFPQEPVMPGVLQVEAMAQCGGLLVLNTVDEPERWSTYFMKIDDVKFRQKVVPGDTLLFKVDLLAPVRHGVSSMKGYVFVGDKIVSEATFTAQIVKNK